MLPFLKSIIKGPAKHIYDFVIDSDYRKWSILETRYRFFPRFKTFTTTIDGYRITVPDSPSFLSSFKDIFLNNTYQFPSDNAEPLIIDLGSNIGLSIIYFKRLYPRAKIIGFEADPKIFTYLKQNILENGFQDIELINKAAWHTNTTLEFSAEGADAGRIAYENDTDIISVEAVDISTFLPNEAIDLLKIDVEGAELIVLKACSKHLAKVNNIILEYHSKINEEQQLDEILSILRQAGFRIHIHPVFINPSPLVEIKTQCSFDLQLNIFAWKELAEHEGTTSRKTANIFC